MLIWSREEDLEAGNPKGVFQKVEDLEPASQALVLNQENLEVLPNQENLEVVLGHFEEH